MNNGHTARHTIRRSQAGITPRALVFTITAVLVVLLVGGYFIGHHDSKKPTSSTNPQATNPQVVYQSSALPSGWKLHTDDAAGDFLPFSYQDGVCTATVYKVAASDAKANTANSYADNLYANYVSQMRNSEVGVNTGFKVLAQSKLTVHTTSGNKTVTAYNDLNTTTNVPYGTTAYVVRDGYYVTMGANCDTQANLARIPSLLQAVTIRY